MIDKINKVRENIIASASQDRTIKLWDLETSRCIMTLTGHNAGIYAMLLINDTHIMTGSLDKTVKVFDIVTGECYKTLENYTGEVYSLVIFNNFEVLIASFEEIKMWTI